MRREHINEADSNPASPAAPGRESGQWPFYQRAADRRAAAEQPLTGKLFIEIAAKVDADTTAWKRDAISLLNNIIGSREEIDIQALRAHLDRVVAVRA